MPKRPRQRYQHPKAPIRQIATVAGVAARSSMKAALKALPKMLDMKKVTEPIRHGRHRGIAHVAVDWHHFRQVLRHPFERLARAYEAGAMLGERKINGAFTARGRVTRYRKGGAGASSGSPSWEESRLGVTNGGPEADTVVAEVLQVLKSPSSWAPRPGGKFDKRTVNYSPGHEGSMCQDCPHFYEKQCELVEGGIDSTYWCELFAFGKAYDRSQS